MNNRYHATPARDGSVIGQRFGRWLVLSEKLLEQKESQKISTVLCRCDCGTEKRIPWYSLKNGNSTSCACDRHVKVSGRRFTRWMVVSEKYSTNPKRPKVKSVDCMCDCGTLKRVSWPSLTSGDSQSCGCLHREKAADRKTSHGMTGTAVYTRWKSMWERCKGQKEKWVRDYVDRGITVCERWKSFENFLKDMGEPAEGQSLDRIDNDGPYSPENCRWASVYEQQNNTRKNINLTYQGETKTLTQWSQHLGFSYSALRNRYIQKWSVERMLSTPVRVLSPRKKKTSSHP
jgi:hypothetical protein